MIDLFRVAEDIQSLCLQRGWRFCFIGGLALQRWGEPRVTKDVDLTLLTGFGNERSYIETLLERYSPRITDVEEFALQNRVLLLKTTLAEAKESPHILDHLSQLRHRKT